ncbi:hypothetical protein FQN54_000609 [Arachnomyces sp. PD_36]|nr:hypothetical protein FQN54_000609 [Arachnomyces sp. PD_36]
MQFSSVSLFTLSMLSSRIAAQYQAPSGFNPGLVNPDELITWCIGQQNACPQVCGGDFSKNECSTETFTFTCECGDGTTPDMTEYKDTLPYYICEATFAQCIEANASDADAQETCKENRDCGSKDASKAETPSETTSSASGMATETKTSDSATNTGASEEPTQTGAAVANTPATGVFTAAMVAAFGLFL